MDAAGDDSTVISFLGVLAELTRDVSDPELILQTVARVLGERLQVSRCAYAEVESDGEHFTIRHDYTHGCASTAGNYQLSLFGERALRDQRAGATLVVRDVDAELSEVGGADMFNAIGVKAIVCCPLLREQKLVAMMAVHQTTPRAWTGKEIALVEAVVERSWSSIERAREDRALREREASLRELADAMPQIVWAARPDGVLDYYNERWFEYIGVRPSDANAARWDAFVHPDDLPRVGVLWAQSLLSGADYTVEFRVRRRDGTYRWFLVRALPAREPRGTVRRWYGTCTDIDDSKRADAALRQSREQMALVVQGAEIGVWYCPLPFDKLVWDDKVKEHFHLPSSADVDIDLFYARIHPEDRERTRHAIDTSIETRQGYAIEYRTVSADGSRIKWVRAMGRGFYDAAGNPLRFDGITIDVTERAEAELALRESERRFRHMSDHAPVMIRVTRADGHCEYLNRKWYDFTGMTSEHALGTGWLDAVHPDDASRAGDIFVAANAARTSFELEYRLRRRDGAYRWCADSATPRFDSSGAYLGYIGSVIDITDRALAEQERASLLESERAARIEAERASRMKDEFLATLSHELRTPLNAIMGWSHLLQTRRSGSDELHKGLAVIDRNARAQARIIDELLDMSRIVAGKIRLDLSRVDLANLVQSALEAARPAADAKCIMLEAIREPGADLTLTGDASRLHQVLWNLLSNAVKFTPKGGSVEVSLRRVEGQLVLRVRDTGEGMAPEFLAFAFDRFRQADASSTRRHGGLGLGLAIVRQLVELHGGRVQAESDGPGRGATFVVTLPVYVGTSVAGEVEPPSARSAPNATLPLPATPAVHDDPEVALEGLRLLVVDDELDARTLVARLLERQGALVTLASSAAEAYALLERQRFDLLISDIGMPGEDGYALLRKLRKSGAPTAALPAVALTAYVGAEDRIRALRAGYRTHLAKPIDPCELVIVVAALTGRLEPA